MTIAFENVKTEYTECDDQTSLPACEGLDGLGDPGAVKEDLPGDILSLPEDVRSILTEKH